MFVFDSNRTQSVETNLLLHAHALLLLLLCSCCFVSMLQTSNPCHPPFTVSCCLLFVVRSASAMRMPCWLLSRVNILKSKRKSIVQSHTHTHASKVVIPCIFCYSKFCFVNFLLLFWFYFGQFFSLLNTKNASKLLKFVIYFLVQLSKFAKSAHAYPIFHSTKRQLQKFPARTICCPQNSYFLISVNICFSLFLPFGWFLLLILFLLSFDPLKKK